MVTLVAGVADAFVSARTLDVQRSVLEANAADQREGLRIAQVRFENGESSALDVSHVDGSANLRIFGEQRGELPVRVVNTGLWD